MFECFCGCGRPVSFTRRCANAMGPKVARELEDWEAIQGATERTRGVQAFVDEGKWLSENLRALVHGERVDGGFSGRKAAKWVRFSRRSRTDLGRRLLHDAVESPEWSEGDGPGSP
jgi:hypothetical protein